MFQNEAYLCSLKNQLNACITVRDNRAAGNAHHCGDLLFSALVFLDINFEPAEKSLVDNSQVHCIEQIVHIVAQRKKALDPNEEIELWYPMRNTRVFKAEAQIRSIVVLAVESLKLYKGRYLPDLETIPEVLEDFDEIWRYKIDPLFDGESDLMRQLNGGGWLRKCLLGDNLFRWMSQSRSRKKADRQNRIDSEHAAILPQSRN
jgi:hypothetical protein